MLRPPLVPSLILGPLLGLLLGPLLGLLLGACGPQRGGDDAPASTTGTETNPQTTHGADDTTDDGLPAECDCVPSQDPLDTCDDLAHAQCEGAALCPPILVTCPRENPDMYACTMEYEYTEDALDCALEALRDRTLGRLEVEAENATCGLEGCGSDQTVLTILPDGRAVVRTCTSSPIAPEGSTSTLGELLPPDYFADCLQVTPTAQRYACLFAGLTPGQDVCG